MKSTMSIASTQSIRQQALDAFRDDAAARATDSEARRAWEKQALLEAVARFFGSRPEHPHWHADNGDSLPILEWDGMRFFQLPFGNLDIALQCGEDSWTDYRQIAGVRALGAWIDSMERLHGVKAVHS